MKLCKDCRWATSATEYAQCDHPRAHYQRGSPVTGKAVDHRWDCAVFRMVMPGMPWFCGPDGKLWEPKPCA